MKEEETEAKAEQIEKPQEKASAPEEEKDSENIPPKKNLKRVRFAELPEKWEKPAKRPCVNLNLVIPKHPIPLKELQHIRFQYNPTRMDYSFSDRSLKPTVSALDLTSTARSTSKKLIRTKGREYTEKFSLTFFSNSNPEGKEDTLSQDTTQRQADGIPAPAQVGKSLI